MNDEYARFEMKIPRQYLERLDEAREITLQSRTKFVIKAALERVEKVMEGKKSQ